MNKGLWLLSLLMILAGLGCILAGRILDTCYRRQNPRIKRVRAKVVDLQLKEKGPGAGGAFRNAYYPVLEYYAGGKLIKTVHPQGGYPSPMQVGDELWIEYDRNNPMHYDLWKPDFQDHLPGILSIAGVCLFLIGAVLFILFAMR